MICRSKMITPMKSTHESVSFKHGVVRIYSSFVNMREHPEMPPLHIPQAVVLFGLLTGGSDGVDRARVQPSVLHRVARPILGPVPGP